MPLFKFKHFLIGLIATVLVVACQNNTVRQSTNSQLANCRTVQQVMNKVCVLELPQRLIALDNPTLADALTLGVPSLPRIFISIFAGIIVDRANRKYLMILSDAVASPVVLLVQINLG